jgi:acyl-CoA dehydrogenase
MMHGMHAGQSSEMASLRASIRERVEAFARHEIAGRDDLRECAVMPPELLRAMGDAGLAGIALPTAYGGLGGDLRALAVAAEALAGVGGVKGVVTTWLSRQLTARLHILGHGSTDQRKAYLLKLAAGRLTPCLAISEPGAGAHPKHLSTRAERDGDSFVLNGEKAYLTNGPIADIFLVLAVTGVEKGRKKFSVLIVPRETPGLHLTEGVKIDFLQPAAHCGIRLENVRVPAANLLGPEGDAFAAISLPMRRAEDAIFAASIAGSIRHQLARLANEMAAGSDGRSLDDDLLVELGRLVTVPDGLSAMAYRAMELLDTDPVQNADRITNIAASARDGARAVQARVRSLIEASGVQPSPGLEAETRDIEKTLGIARSAHDIQARRRALALIDSTRTEEKT